MKRFSLIPLLRSVIGAALLVALCVPGTLRAQSIILDSNEERIFHDFNWIPYAFFSDSFGLGFGVGGGYSGWHEEQTSLLGAITLGT